MSKAQSKARARGRTSRLFIIDTSCAIPFGHSMPALNHFRDVLGPYFGSVLCFCAKIFPEDLAIQNRLERHFTFLYNEQLNAVSQRKADAAIELHDGFDDRAFDPFEAIATQDMRELIAMNDVTQDDVVFLPGADYYGVLGALAVIGSMPESSRPKLVIRLIGVFEAVSRFVTDASDALMKMLSSARKSGISFILAAETPRYADFLHGQTGIVTDVMPYPETFPVLPLKKRDSFNILCAGSARLDKGFHHLFEIMRNLVISPPTVGIRLTSQILPYKYKEWDSYTSQLYAMPGVTLLEPTITSNKMASLYEECHAVLLPYAQDVYHLRGSAVMMEAASAGRPCITLAGTAFSEQVLYYGLGVVVNEIGQIPDAIRAMSQTSSEKLRSMMSQARHRYLSDVDAVYNRVFSQ